MEGWPAHGSCGGNCGPEAALALLRTAKLALGHSPPSYEPPQQNPSPRSLRNATNDWLLANTSVTPTKFALGQLPPFIESPQQKPSPRCLRNAIRRPLDGKEAKVGGHLLLEAN